jgi:hypothetical protein
LHCRHYRESLWRLYAYISRQFQQAAFISRITDTPMSYFISMHSFT